MGDPLEDFFRQRLEGHEETPPPAAWHRIQEDITPTKAPKRFIGWWLAPLLLLLVGGSVYLFKQLAVNPQIAAGTENKAIVTKKTEAGNLANSPESPVSQSSGSLAKTNATPDSKAPGSDINSAQNNNPEAVSPGNKADADENVRPEKQPAINTPRKTASVAITAGTRKTRARSSKKVKTSAEASGNLAAATIPANRKPAVTKTPMAQTQDGNSAGTETRKGTLSKNSSDGTTTGSAQYQGTAGLENTTNTQPLAVIAATPEKDEQQPGTEQTVTDEATADIKQAMAADSAAADSVQKATAQHADSVNTAEAVQPDSVSQKERKTLFGFYAGSQVNFRTLTPNQTDETYIQNIEQKKAAAPERMKLTAGAMVQHRLTDRFAVEGGLGLLYSRDRIQYQTSTEQISHLETSFTSTGMSLQPIRKVSTHATTSKALYTHVRGGASYALIKTALADISVSGGAMLHYRTWQKTETTVNNKEAEAEFEPVKLQPGLYGGLRFGRTIGNSLSVALEPSVSHYFSSWHRQNPALQVSSQSYNLNLIFLFK